MASPLALSNSFSHSMSFGEASMHSIPSGMAELLVQSSASAELVDMDAILQDYMQDLHHQVLQNSASTPRPSSTPPEVCPKVSPAIDPQRGDNSDGTDKTVEALATSQPFPLVQLTPFAEFSMGSQGAAGTGGEGRPGADAPDNCAQLVDDPLQLPKLEATMQHPELFANVGGSTPAAQFLQQDSIPPGLLSAASSQPNSTVSQRGGSDGTDKPRSARQPPKRSQEKNRRAQQRFRDRQKARVAELEAQVATLQGRVARLVQDAAENESRLECMSRVLKLREAEIDRLRGLLSAEHGSDEKKLDDGIVTPLTAAFKESLTLTVRDGQTLVLTPDNVKNLRREELCVLWREYVAQLRVVMVEIHQTHEPSGGPRHLRIARLVDEVCLLGMRVALANPQAFRMFVACSMEDGSMLPCSDRSRWREVARSLGLSVQQRVQLRLLRTMVLERVSDIQTRRRSIQDKLLADMEWARGAAEDAKRMMEAQSALDEMRASLREEMILKLDFNYTCYKHMLLPVQVANLFVKSYPYSPDNMGICTWIAAEDGDVEAARELMSPTPSAGADGFPRVAPVLRSELYGIARPPPAVPPAPLVPAIAIGGTCLLCPNALTVWRHLLNGTRVLPRHWSTG
eukprot:jgi/Botrbrau1/742/Bobra.0181s0002.2